MTKKIKYIIEFYLHLSNKNIDYKYTFKTGCKRSAISIELDYYPYYFKIKNSKPFLTYRGVNRNAYPLRDDIFIYLNKYPKKYRLF